jgi:dolichol-phosphate mannosyltransferase
MPYDASNGFRHYRLSGIPKDVFGFVSSKAYSFFFESLYILQFNGFTMGEIPLKLPARKHRESKMTLAEVCQSARLLLAMSLKTRFIPGRYRVRIPTGTRPS